MKKSLLCIWMLPLLIVSIAIVGVRANPATMGVEPQSIVDVSLGPGSTFKVEIWARQVSDLAGLEFHLRYNTTVLTATLIEYGGIFGAYEFELANEIHDADGYLWYGVMAGFGQPSFNGDGKAAIITFSVDSLGGSALDLYNTLFSDSLLPPTITYPEELDGFFSNRPFHDVAVTNVTASPTEVEVGEPVTINVTVANEGNYNETLITVTVYADMIAYGYTYDVLYGLTDLWVDVGNEKTVGTQTDISLENGTSTTLTFTWDTAGVEAGNYTISAEASTVPDEADTTNNLFVPPPLETPRPSPPPPSPSPAYSPTSVTVTPLPAHDIAITSVTFSPGEVTAGKEVTINVTVTNQGNFDETFDVTVYYGDKTVGTQTDISLENGTSTTLTFTWDTTDVAKGTYTIKATASVVPGETDTGDNTREAEDQIAVLKAAAAPNIIIYALVAVVAIIIIAAAAIYILKIRKRA